MSPISTPTGSGLSSPVSPASRPLGRSAPGRPTSSSPASPARAGRCAGSYMALGKDSGARIRFDLKLQDTRTGETVAVLSQTGNEADLVDLVAATGEALRAKLSLGELTPAEREGMRAFMPRGDVLRLY